MSGPTSPSADQTSEHLGTALAGKLAALERLTTTELREEWRRLFRAPPPASSRDLLLRATAYRLQEIAHGGLSKATLRRLRTSEPGDDACKGKSRAMPQPRLTAGARLVREWHGRTHTVMVTENGFAFQGTVYRSLTQIAREITGVHWSGPRFFGLTRTRPAGPAAPPGLDDETMVSPPELTGMIRPMPAPAMEAHHG